MGPQAKMFDSIKDHASGSWSNASSSASDTSDDTSSNLDYGNGEEFHNTYIIGSRINQGSFGSVWRLQNDSTKCVKVMSTGEDEQANHKRAAHVREFQATQMALSETSDIELFMDDG